MITFLIVLTVIGCMGLFLARRAEIDRDISNIIDDTTPSDDWKSMPSIDVQTNPYLQEYNSRDIE